MWFVGFGTWFTVASCDVSKHKIFLARTAVHWNTKPGGFLQQNALFMPREVFLYFCCSLSELPSSGEYNFYKPKVRLDLFLMTVESTKIHLSLNYQATSISNSRAAFVWSLSLWMTGATWMQGIEMVKMLVWMYIYANIFRYNSPSLELYCLRLLYTSQLVLDLLPWVVNNYH